MTAHLEGLEEGLKRRQYEIHNDIREVRKQRDAALACLSILLSGKPIEDIVMREIIDFEKDPFSRAHVTVNAFFVLGRKVHF